MFVVFFKIVVFMPVSLCCSRLYLQSLLLLVVTVQSPAVLAEDFITSNGFHPIKALFGFPYSRLEPLAADEVGAKGSGTKRGNSQLSVQLDFSNIFSGGSRDGELLVFDGESTRVSLSYQQQISSCLAFGVDLPFVTHQPGSLDQFIETWHDTFGLPNANREDSPRDQLQFTYQDEASSQQLSLDAATAALGDIQLQGAYRAGCLNAIAGLGSSILSSSVVRLGLKLPTGSLDDFSGSEEFDFFLDLTLPRFSLTDGIGFRASGGFLIPGGVATFERLESQVLFATTAFTFKPRFLTKRGLDLITQLDFTTALFDSGLRELGAFSTQLGVGGGWQLSPRQRWEIAFLEDIGVDTAPDFVFHLRYQNRW